MQLDLIAKETTVDDVRSTMRQAWADAITSGAVSSILNDELPDLAADVTTADFPFTVEPGEDGYGFIELIAIAVAGRLVSTIPERLLVRLFDEVIWPKLTSRFGSSLKRTGDDE